ncbi:MAG TPA: glycoside hydrolase family 18 protein [Kofleriaceae bacterium]|nr:glycoside hydrolase family 18 protein [Kofleriaceae bacterium]
MWRVLLVAFIVACGSPAAKPDGALGDDDAPGSGSDTGGDGSGGGTGQWVLGYYVGYDISSYPIASIDWTALTHVAFAPMVVKADQTLDFSFDDQQGMGPQHAMDLATAAHAHGVKALLMLGGAGAGPNIANAARPANRAAFVTRLLDALSTLGYDGIDLDWEDSVVLDDLVGLAHDLRAAKPDIVLSYPGGMINGNFQTVDARMAQLAASLDRFFVQSYYPSTAVAGSGWDSWFLAPQSGVSPTTPIAADDTLMRHEAVGIPKAKLGLGIGAYAICYTGGITGPRQPTGSNTQITGGDNTYPLRLFFAAGSTFANAAATAKKYDAVAQQPYLSFTAAVNDAHCGGNTQYISYEDEQSIHAKATFSRGQGYGGVIVWTINEMTPATMTALHDGFLAP